MKIFDIAFEMANCSPKDGIMTIKESSYRSNDKYIVQKKFLVQNPDGYLLRFTD